MRLLPPTAILIAATGLFAQGGSPIRYDFLELQETLHKAMDKVSPSTVTVQTFGGTRKVCEQSRNVGGLADDGRSSDPHGGRAANRRRAADHEVLDRAGDLFDAREHDITLFARQQALIQHLDPGISPSQREPLVAHSLSARSRARFEPWPSWPGS